MNVNSFKGRLRLIAILEGISYLLLGVTMPLKYMLDIPEPNFVVGMAHGVLFILYILLCAAAIFKYKWGVKDSALSLIASLVPFGTFYADQKVFRHLSK